MQNTISPPPPRPALPRRLLDDAWWLAAALVTDRPARVIPFPARPSTAPRSGGAVR